MFTLKKYHIALITLLPVFFSACSYRFYTPNTNPTPLFRNKGDFYFNASTNCADKASATIGTSLFKGFGMYGGYAGAYDGWKVKDYSSSSPYNLYYSYYRYKGNMANFGAGYYLSEEISEKFRFEIFGDMAIGNYKNTFATGSNPLNSRSGYLKGDFKRIGILTNIGYSDPIDEFSIAYTCRFSHIDFSDRQLNTAQDWDKEQKRLDNKSDYGYNLLEHGLNICSGSHDVMYSTQLLFSHCLNSKGEEIDAIKDFNFSFNVGITLNLNFLDR